MVRNSAAVCQMCSCASDAWKCNFTSSGLPSFHVARHCTWTHERTGRHPCPRWPFSAGLKLALFTLEILPRLCEMWHRAGEEKKGEGEKRRNVGEGQQGRGGVRGVMDGRINSGEGMRKERTRRCDMMGEGETWGERRCSDSVSTGVWNRPDIWSVCLCVCKRDYKSWRPAPFLLHTQEKTKTLLVWLRWFFQGQKVTHPTSTVQPIQTYTSTQTT